MKNELKLGNINQLALAIACMDNITSKRAPNQEYATFTVWTDTTEIDALREVMMAAREKEHNPRVRDGILHTFQHREHGMGAYDYSLGTNIYGFAVGCSLQSNISGGRWNQMASGATLSQAIEFGCLKAKQKNCTFSFSAKFLAELLAAEGK